VGVPEPVGDLRGRPGEGGPVLARIIHEAA
jgi:hypothetical protein